MKNREKIIIKNRCLVGNFRLSKLSQNGLEIALEVIEVEIDVPEVERLIIEVLLPPEMRQMNQLRVKVRVGLDIGQVSLQLDHTASRHFLRSNKTLHKVQIHVEGDIGVVNCLAQGERVHVAHRGEQPIEIPHMLVHYRLVLLPERLDYSPKNLEQTPGVGQLDLARDHNLECDRPVAILPLGHIKPNSTLI
jgi:hypothetical protein